MEYLKIANGLPMWIATGIAVSIVLFQSILFMRKSMSCGRQIGISDETLKVAVKASIISSFGPALAIVVGIVPLLVTMGGPTVWMRESMIGSVTYELMAAGFGTAAMGVTLGQAGMDGTTFACALWAMTLGSTGWVLFTAFFTPQLDKFRTLIAGGRKALIPIISASAMLGAFAYLDADRILKFDAGTVACLAGFAVMAALVVYGRKSKARWVGEWALTIAMVVGMVAGALV
ncbi:MAG TPA: DUF5058 family protein [Spirochaetales bacterium]|nr:DUF5058 family protein [Spirochaetales bacterium]HRY55114.1 DUF5058 family protein [Spirochaetia bacterium]HRZ63875.1 DUF5058 family protein [Spirochaetia bacterium]